MEKNIKLLIVEDVRDILGVSRSVFVSRGYDVIACKKDGRDIIQAIKKELPDVIIIDMFMANYDAPAVMRAISDFEKVPAVIVCASYNNGLIEKEALMAGADYFLVKPFDYNSLCDRIDSLSRHNLRILKKGEPSVKSNLELEAVIADILHQIGVPAHLKGYRFLKTAILLAVSDPDIINHITQKLYPAVAKAQNTTAIRVERSIRTAIEAAWIRGDIDVINSYFGYTISGQRGKPTNGEFISLISDKLSLKAKIS